MASNRTNENSLCPLDTLGSVLPQPPSLDAFNSKGQDDPKQRLKAFPLMAFEQPHKIAVKI